MTKINTLESQWLDTTEGFFLFTQCSVWVFSIVSRAGIQGCRLLSSYRFVFPFTMAQRLKHLPAMRNTQVRSLGWEDPLEKEMATHSSILAWRIPWREEPGGLQSTGSQSDTNQRLNNNKWAYMTLSKPERKLVLAQEKKKLRSYKFITFSAKTLFSMVVERVI